MHRAETHALLIQTCAREVAGGVLAVVALEVVVDQLVDLLGREQALLDVGMVEQPQHHHRGHHHVAGQAAQPPPAQPVERGREPLGEEAGEPPPRADPGADRLVARLGQQGGQMGDERRVGGRRTDDGEVGGDLLVEIDQLVALGPAEPAAVDQPLEPLPLVRVGQHVRVEVHALTLVSRVGRIHALRAHIARTSRRCRRSMLDLQRLRSGVLRCTHPEHAKPMNTPDTRH